MALESRIKLTADNFSPQSDLIEVFSKKAGVVGVINPSQIASPPSGGAGAIQFSDGSAFASDASNLFWDDTNNRLGVGTNAPSATAHIVGANTSSSSYALKVFNSVGQGSLSVTNDGVVQIGDISTQGYPSVLAIMRNSGIQRGTTFTQYSSALIIQNPFGGVTYQNTPITIVGSGSTSATTSLLVQNSSANNTLQVLDDAKVIVNGNNAYSGDNFRVNNSSGNYVMKTTNGYTAEFGYFGAGNSVSIMDGGVSSAFRAGLPLISPSWYAGYFSCATGDVRIGQDPTGTNANPSAILQCNTTTQGFLPPRMTTAEKNAIATPAIGLMVFDTTLGRPCFYNGAWVTL